MVDADSHKVWILFDMWNDPRESRSLAEDLAYAEDGRCMRRRECGIGKINKVFSVTVRQNLLCVLLLLLSVILLGLINAVAYTEALRRMTQAVWEREWSGFFHALCGFGAVILFSLVLNIGKRRSAFLLKKKLTFACEDAVYEVFSGKEYWKDFQEKMVLGHIRKNVPDTMRDIVEQVTGTLSLCVMILAGCLYGAGLNGPVMTVSIAATVCMAFLTRETAGRVPELYREFEQRNGRLYQLLWEQVKNREIARFLNRDKALKVYETESESYLKVLLKIKKETNGAGLFSQFGSTVLIMLAAFLGGTLALRQRLSFADLLALIMLVPNVASGMFQVPSRIQLSKKLSGSCRVIDSLLEKEPRPERKEKLEEPVRSLEVSGLCFSYEAGRQILKKTTVKLEGAGFYVLAGDSGCGKSTLLKCIAGLLPYEEGKILLNGRNLKNLDRDAHWEGISYIGQKPFLLDGTLRYNITLQKDERAVDEKRLEEAIRTSDLEGLIRQSPEGLWRMISEDALSKGERLKINIARAVYRETGLLLMDEMTEGLDPQAEIRILEALKDDGKKRGILCLCISHHVETQKSADRVLFMEDGRIEAEGTYEELCGSCKTYARMTGREKA